MKLADRGVIPRLLSGIFRRGKKIMKDSEGQTTVQVALSYYEIYNDKVFDLLEPVERRTPMGLPLRAEANGKTVVAGLTERACEDLKDFEKLYIESNLNRVTAATKLNAHSSRSHAVLRVKLTQTTGDMVRESTASAIDLAGSEDNRRTDNDKTRLVESAAINKSLFVLSQCIEAISRGDKRIPYRESKMTRILSLGQNKGITVMILNLAPMKSYHLDTLSSLNVSSRAKRIEVREIENEVVYKQVPKMSYSVSGGGIRRQPLQPLANAHNVHSGKVAAKEKEAAKAEAIKAPVKAFSVYTDLKIKPSPTKIASRPTANTGALRTVNTSNKRPSENEPTLPRPSKLARPTTQVLIAPLKTSASVTVSAAQIEAMVEKKVSEILAARMAEEKSAPEPPVEVQPDINVQVQKRLEALERRIKDEDQREDGQSDGLRFLLAARQHKEKGDEASALKAYEAALPYFPGQAKLMGKIERLRARLESAERGSSERVQPKTPKRKRKVVVKEDEVEYDGTEADAEEEYMGKPKARRIKTETTLNFANGGLPSELQQLIDIVNSRDLVAIKGLVGFGTKRARALVDYLEEDKGHIESIDQLMTLPGMGGRVIERAYEGLLAA